MQKTKKLFSALIAVVMLVSVFTFGVNAGAPSFEGSETAQVGIGFEVVNTDGSKVTTVVPGETVTVNIYATAKTSTDVLKSAKFVIFYNTAVYSVVADSQQFVGPINNIDTAMSSTDVFGNTSAQYANTMASTYITEDDKAHGWNGVVQFIAAADGSKESYNLQSNADKVFATFKLKVSDAVAPGTKADIGAPQASIFAKRGSSFNNVCSTTVPSAPTTIAAAGKILGVFNNTITVASAAPTYTVEKAKSQALFTGPKPTPDDAFTYRLTSKISAADLTAMNSGSNTITKLGFIAANSDVTTVAEAKAAVEAGTMLPAGWKGNTTDYISQADATADAFFGCRIQNISHAAQDKDITCVAYVAYSDGAATHYVWYAAPVNAAVSTGYDAAVSSWVAQQA